MSNSRRDGAPRVASKDGGSERPSRRGTRRDDDRALDALRLAFDVAREGILICDSEDRIVFFNNAFARFAHVPLQMGVRFEDLVRARIAAGDIPVESGEEEEWLRARMRERKSPGAGIELQSRGCWLRATDQRTADGGTLTLVTDISDRKAVEIALRTSEMRYRSLVENTSDWFWEQDADFRFTSISSRGMPLRVLETASVGRARWELPGLEPLTGSWEEHRADLAAHRRFDDLLVRRVDPSGVESFLSSSGAPVYDAQGKFAGYSGLTRDVTGRVRAEKAAEAASKRLKDALENLGEMLVLTDSDDRIVIANQRFLHFNAVVAEHAKPGCHYEDHIRAGIKLGMFPDALGQEESWLAARMANRHHPKGPVERRRQDGRWLLVDDQKLPDGGIVSFGLEITLQKQAEAAAENLRRQLRYALEFARAIFWDFDLIEDTIHMLEGWAPLMKGPSGENIITRRQMADVIHPDDLGRTVDAFVSTLKGTATEYSVEYRLKLPDGQWHWILSRGQISSRDAAGRALRMAGMNIDITERKEAEQALLASELRFRSLVDLSHDSFWETDQQHRYIKRSRSGSIPVIQGLAESDIGKTPWELPHVAPDEAGWARHRAQIAAHEVFRDFEVARVMKDGSVRYLEGSGEPVFDADGVFIGYRGVGKDITQRKLAEEALRRLNAELEQRIAERTAALETAYRELESFSYSVSHDLRAPLRSISGYAGLLREDEGARMSEEGRKYLGIIDDNAGHMGRLIDALLALGRTSRQTLNRQRVDLAALVAGILDELKPEFPGAVLTVASLPVVDGDPTLLRQVFANLVGNALKYSAKAVPPRVEVKLETRDGERVFIVSDNGVGFDMAYADKLFQAFGRLHTDVEFQGTGIGLVLTKLIVERHGGRIWADSRPGAGAMFCFTLGTGTRATAPTA